MQGGDGGVVTPRGGGHDHLAAIFHIRTHIQISFSGGLLPPFLVT